MSFDSLALGDSSESRDSLGHFVFMFGLISDNSLVMRQSCARGRQCATEGVCYRGTTTVSGPVARPIIELVPS